MAQTPLLRILSTDKGGQQVAMFALIKAASLALAIGQQTVQLPKAKPIRSSPEIWAQN